MSRIVFFVNSMHAGGAERVAALLSNYWVRKGYDVLLVPTFSGRGDCHYPLDVRVRLEYLADRVGTTRKTLWTIARRLLAMRSIVKDFQADFVVSFLTQVNVATLLATRGLRVPVVVSERSIIYCPEIAVGSFWFRMRNWTYPGAFAVVMQTQKGVTALRQVSPSSCGVVIPNPCQFPLPEHKPTIKPTEILSQERLVLLSVGRLGEEKGFSTLLTSFSRIYKQFPEWELVILGEGSERAALEKQMISLGLEGRVHLPGQVGNMGEWYHRADLFAMSSRFEGFPNALMEAMAHGVPAVSFNCDTGPADLIEDGFNGYLVPPSEGSEGLANKLEHLMADVNLRDAMGERATTVRKRYSMEHVGALWDLVLGLEAQDV